MERCGFFDANLVGGEYDRVYLASQFAAYFASFIGNGVFAKHSNQLQVVEMPTPQMQIGVERGQAWINGYWYENTDMLYLPIDVADGVLNRIDSVVLRLGFAERNIWLAVKKGTPAVNPVAPEVTRTADYYELQLATISIPAGSIKITQAQITDTRMNQEVCGWVTGLIDQVDTTTLFNQYVDWYTTTTGQAEADIEAIKQQFQAELDTWFDGIKDILDENLAGNLLNLIEEHKNDANNPHNVTPQQIGAVSQEDFMSHENDKVAHIDYAVASGTNTYIASIQGITALVEGLSIKIKFQNANTGASTLNINGLGAKEIRKSNGNTLSSGNIKAGQICHLVYTGSVFQLLGEGGEYGTAQPEHVLQGYTIGTEQGIVAGTMLNQGAKIITPSTVNQAIPAGYHNGLGYVKGDVNLKAENILNGVSIFGVTGTLLKGRATASGTLTFTTTRSNKITKIFLPDFNFYPWLIITYNTLSDSCFIGSFSGSSTMPNDFFDNVPRTTGYNISFYRMYTGSGVYYPKDGYLSKTGSYINFNNDYYSDGEKEGTLKWVVIG